MIVIEKKKYHLIKLNDDAISSFKKEFKKWKRKHCIVELSEKMNALDKKYAVLLDVASAQNENGMSFVLVQKGINIDLVPETVSIAPTLQEAEDILEMENIERDLGF